MFGDWLLGLAQWVGGWNIFIAVYAIGFGIAGGVFWRTYPSAARDHRRQQQAEELKRFCRECRWATPDPHYAMDWRFARCMHASARAHPERFLVTGEDRWDDMLLCAHARNPVLGGICGPTGRFFEAGPQLISVEPSRDAIIAAEHGARP